MIVTTPDNLTVVLTQIADRQDDLAARLDGLTQSLADQTARADEQDEQLRVQAAALRSTAAQLSTNIRDVAKAQRGNGAARGSGAQSASNAGFEERKKGAWQGEQRAIAEPKTNDTPSIEFSY